MLITFSMLNPNFAGFHEVNGRAVEKHLEDHVKPLTNEDLAVKLEKSDRMMALRSLQKKTLIGILKD